MRNKLKILYIKPEGIEIPFQTSIEKIIWNYKLKLEEKGHIVDIEKQNFKKDYDIIHCHMFDQSLELHNNNEKYIFSLHNYYTYFWNKDNEIYKNNLDSIKKSIISITHNEYLINYFDKTDKLFYLPYGVNSSKHINKNNLKFGHKLLYLIDDNNIIEKTEYNRKELKILIESAKEINLPITIIGTKRFFEKNKDIIIYDKLNIITDPNDYELINIFNEHTIFLNSSIMESCYSNLNILESMSYGIPVISLQKHNELNGLVKTNFIKDDLINKINFTIDNYDKLRIDSLNTSKQYDWKNVVNKLEQIYYNVIDIKENFTSEKTRNKIIDIYNNSKIVYKEPIKQNAKLKIDFHDGVKVSLLSFKGDKTKYKIDFIDDKNNSTIYTSFISCGQWCKPNRKWYTDWIIKVTNIDSGNIINIPFNLKHKDIYIKIDDNGLIKDIKNWMNSIEDFKKKHDCVIYCYSIHNDLLKDYYKNINFVDKYFDYSMVYAKYNIGYSEDRNINPNGNTGKNIAKDVLGL